MPQSNIEESPSKASAMGSAENTGLFCILPVVFPVYDLVIKAEYIDKYSCQ